MARLVDRSEYNDGDFELNERVSFMHNGQRLYGVIARVYNTRSAYHVEFNGERYEVSPYADKMRRE